MHILIAAVGRIRAGAEQELVERYRTRLPWKMDLIEIPESQARNPAQRREEEAQRLQHVTRDAEARVLLAVKGKQFSSEMLAAQTGQWQQDGRRHAAFLIGGPDGHSPGLETHCDVLLSFGSMTWPHKLVRVMLAEQLYRAYTITAGHPYHSGH